MGLVAPVGPLEYRRGFGGPAETHQQAALGDHVPLRLGDHDLEQLALSQGQPVL